MIMLILFDLAIILPYVKLDGSADIRCIKKLYLQSCKITAFKTKFTRMTWVV